MYWVWAIEPTSDAEAIIYGTSPVLDEMDVDFEEGLMIHANMTSIEIVRGQEFQGTLTENLFVSGVNGLLFSSRLRDVLGAIMINNIQYWPVSMHNTMNQTRIDDYYLSNIVGRVSCLDRDNSVLEMASDDSDSIEFIDVLAIDEMRAKGFDLFRLHEDPHFIIASDRVKNACERHHVTGVQFYRPCDYPY